MPAPVSRLPKQEIIWLSRHRCNAHSHTYLDHYNCYLKEQEIKERVGFLDIETSHLKADFGICFCYCIKIMGKRKIISRCVTKKELYKNLDREVIKQCVEDLKQFDRVITYYGSRFDLPFLRSRALHWNIDFPTIRSAGLGQGRRATTPRAGPRDSPRP